MNFNYGDLERLFGKIQAIVNIFEQGRFQNRTSRMHLANGDKIDYRVSESNISHLLGININYLMGLGIFRENDATSLLKKLLENAYRINDLKNKRLIDYNQLFDEHILDKIDAFDLNIKIDINETELVSKYDPDRIVNLNNKTEKQLSYVIVKKHDDKYYMLWLAKSLHDKYYYPQSNRVFNSFEELDKQLKNFVTNQELTYINGITIGNTEIDYNKNIILPLIERRNKTIKLLEYKKLYKASVDVADSFIYSINESIKHKDKNSEIAELITYFVNSIENEKLVDAAILENTILESIGNAWNNYLCSKYSTNTDNAISIKYSELIKELEKFKKLLKQSNEQLENKSEMIELLNAKNQELLTDNEKYASIFDKIKTLVNK